VRIEENLKVGAEKGTLLVLVRSSFQEALDQSGFQQVEARSGNPRPARDRRQGGRERGRLLLSRTIFDCEPEKVEQFLERREKRGGLASLSC